MKKHLNNRFMIIAAASVLTAGSVQAAEIVKTTATTTNLAAGVTWINGVAPGSGDIATWLLDTDTGVANDQSSFGNNAFALSTTANTSWAGIKITGATTNVQINNTTDRTLTLGASGVTVSGLKNLIYARGDTGTVNKSLVLGADQSWDIAAFRTFFVNSGAGGQVFDVNGKTLILNNSGTVAFTNGGILRSDNGQGMINVNAGLFNLSGFTDKSISTENSITVNVATGAVHQMNASIAGSSLNHTVNGNGGSVRVTGGVMAGTINMNGGTLTVSGGSTTTGTVTLGAATTTINTSASGGTIDTLSGSGTANFSLGGAALSFNLAGSNAGFTGTSIITSGIVYAGTNTSFGSGTIEFNVSGIGTIASSDTTARTFGNAVTMTGNGTVGLTGSGNGSGNLTFTGGLNIGTGTKTLTVDNAQTEFSGAVTGTDPTGALTKAGYGTLTISGNSAYAGNMIVNTGTLQLPATGRLKFVLGNSSGTSNTLSGSGAGIVTLDGGFTIDTATADNLTSGTWVLENAPAATYGSGFKVYLTDGTTPWTDAGGDKWTKAGTFGKTWTFNETTGTLTLTGGGYDSWVQQIANAADRDRTDDPDSDGLTNLQEFLFSKNPNVNDGTLVSSTVSGSNLILSWLQRESGTTYSLMESATLAAGSWVPSAVVPQPDLQPGDPANYDQWKAVIPQGAGKKFFRVQGVENSP